MKELNSAAKAVSNGMPTDQARRLQEFIEKEDLRYQSFNLAGGVRTKGHDRSYLEGIIFRDSVEGESFLDVGCYLGYFCIEALKRGAGSATGLEANSESVRKAQGLAQILGYSPSYIKSDFETWEENDQQFDHVLCLNVLHHMYDAVHSLRRLMRMARKRVVLEVARLTWRDYKHGFVNPLAMITDALPLIHLGAPKDHYHVAARTYLFTPAAMKMLFNVHTALYEPIRITASPFKGRFVVEARRRQIGHLVAVAGVTSSGKSTFAKRLKNDAAFRKKYGLTEGDWLVIEPRDIERLPPGKAPNVIVEYDLLLANRADVQSFDRLPAFHLLDSADTVTALTVVPPSGRINEQMNDKEIARLRKKVGTPMANALIDLYIGRGGQSLIKDVYVRWLDHALKHGADPANSRIVANSFDSFEDYRLEQFDEVFEGIHGVSR